MRASSPSTRTRWNTPGATRRRRRSKWRRRCCLTSSATTPRCRRAIPRTGARCWTTSWTASSPSSRMGRCWTTALPPTATCSSPSLSSGLLTSPERCIQRRKKPPESMGAFDLQGDFAGLALMVVLLGMKHGFDADHLAAIDGLTRYNARARPALARAAGVLFSVGHGAVVAGVAVVVSVLARVQRGPSWLEVFGAWVSVGALTLLAVMNIVAVLRTPGQEVA